MSINGKFGVNYSPVRTKWLEVTREHRAAVVEALVKLPDKDAPPADPSETEDGVWAVIEEWARLAKISTNAVWSALRTETRIDVGYIGDMTPDQLAATGRAARAKVAELKKAGT